jgi:hypothetical protein
MAKRVQPLSADFFASACRAMNAKMTTAPLDRRAHHSEIVEIGNESWSFKNHA